MTTQEQANQHQAEVASLTAVAALSIREWFAQLEAAGLTTLALVRLALFVMAPEVAARFGTAAATIAADWYEEVRQSSGASGSFVPHQADAPPVERINALVGWATTPTDQVRNEADKLARGDASSLLVPDIKGAPDAASLDGLTVPEPNLALTAERVRQAKDDATRAHAGAGPSSSTAGTPVDLTDFRWVQERVVAGMQRAVSDVARETVMGSALADRKARGWQRVSGDDGDCAFCALLIARGAVYSEDSAKFGSHENCNCMAAPVFSDGTVGKAVDVDDYKPSGRNITDADRARVRAWIKANQ